MPPLFAYDPPRLDYFVITPLDSNQSRAAQIEREKEEQTMMFQGILDLHVAVKSHKAKSESRWEVS
jgi:hypothetical protein